MERAHILLLMQKILEKGGRKTPVTENTELREISFRSLDFSELALRVEQEVGRELNFGAAGNPILILKFSWTPRRRGLPDPTLAPRLRLGQFVPLMPASGRLKLGDHVWARSVAVIRSQVDLHTRSGGPP